jgi:DNA-nicking Smr family endonuclease
MSRKLSEEERELWERLGRSVRPLPGRRSPDDPPPDEPAGPAPAAGEKPVRAARSASAPQSPARPEQPALAPLEERTRRRLARGIVDVDARIDLHGMRQERAFNALLAFLQKAQARGERVVLVVTGKGREGGERGVLRSSVPAWLSRPDLRHLVVGWQEAGRRHGGAGALYVRVRRRREVRTPRA